MSAKPKPAKVKMTRTQRLRIQAAERRLQTKGTTLGWASLPEGLLCLVFHLLGPVDLLFSGSVCKHWHTVASNQGLWERWYAARWPKSQPAYPSSWKRSYQIRLLTLRNKWLASSLKRVDPFTQQPDIFTTLRSMKAKLLLKIHLRATGNSPATQRTLSTKDARFCRLGLQASFAQGLSEIDWKLVSSLSIMVSVLVDPAIITNKVKLRRGRRPPRSRHAVFHIDQLDIQTLVASNVTHQLFQLAPGLVLGRWHDQGLGESDVAAVLVTTSYSQLRSALSCSSRLPATVAYPPAPMDDVDPRYGLDDLTAIVELNGSQLEWSEQFRHLDGRIVTDAQGSRVLQLCLVGDEGKYPHSTAQGTLMYRLLAEAVESRFNGIVNISWTLMEQGHRLIDSSSQLLLFSSNESDISDYAYSEGSTWSATASSTRSRLSVVCIQETKDTLLLRDVCLCIPLSTINNHFSTKHF
eukprot:m.206665 g.206665  ORF g.206665 m.206665 type:complete len:466 (-) comp17108_c0_seq3:35-1432(-)